MDLVNTSAKKEWRFLFNVYKRVYIFLNKMRFKRLNYIYLKVRNLKLLSACTVWWVVIPLEAVDSSYSAGRAA